MGNVRPLLFGEQWFIWLLEGCDIHLSELPYIDAELVSCNG